MYIQCSLFIHLLNWQSIEDLGLGRMKGQWLLMGGRDIHFTYAVINIA